MNRFVFALLLAAIVAADSYSQVSDKPNIVLIFIDDMGYADIGPFGNTQVRTPHLDKFAAEGMKFTSFYATPVCSMSRACLMTGCYNARVSIPGVLFPRDNIGLNPNEVTLAEIVKQKGYATCAVGKWHLGHHPEFMPTRQGFDHYFGLPYSNDMLGGRKDMPPLPLYNDEKIIETEPDQSQLTRRYTEEAVKFIRGNKDKPFFVYLPHSMIHFPLAASDAFKDKSKMGLIGDTIEEIDWSVGQIMSTLSELKLDNNTLVIFTSDNGPAKRAAPPFRGNKGTNFEGGVREPCMMRWPGKIPAGTTCNQIAGNIDILPTFAKLVGVEPSKERVIDGRDITPLMLNPKAGPVRDTHLYLSGTKVAAIRQGDWKLFLKAPEDDAKSDSKKSKDSKAKKKKGGPTSSLYNLASDPGETNDVAAANPEIVAKLKQELTTRDAEMEANKRPAGRVTVSQKISTEKPNIVFILADDLGYMDIGAFNPKTFYETPNINALANRGMKFTQGYAACCVCSPTRGSIMTGKYPPRFGITNFILGKREGKLLPAACASQLPLEEVTIAETLRDAGYSTFASGKWHLGNAGFMPADQGFTTDATAESGPKSANAESRTTDPKRTDRITEDAVRFIEQNKDKPFFAYLPFNAPHVPIGAREDLVAKWEAKAKLAPADAWGQEGDHKLRLVQNNPQYAAMLEQLDQGIGSVMKALEKNGLTEKTIVVFMSDNGGLATAEGWPTSNLPLRAGKGWPYEGGVREPMIVVAPGVTTPGTTCDSPVISTDFYPTLLELVGLALKPEQHLDGVSFTAALKGDNVIRGKPLFWHYPHYANQGGSPNGVIRDGDWKLIEWYEDGALELYNIPQDLSEKNSIAAQNPAKTKELHEKLIAWRQEVGALMPTPNPGFDPNAKPQANPAKKAKKK